LNNVYNTSLGLYNQQPPSCYNFGKHKKRTTINYTNSLYIILIIVFHHFMQVNSKSPQNMSCYRITACELSVFIAVLLVMFRTTLNQTSCTNRNFLHSPYIALLPAVKYNIHIPSHKCTLEHIKIDWLIALRHISTERLLGPRNVAKIWSRFVDKYNRVWRNADWPASWHISTKSYQWQWKCGWSLTSCPGREHFKNMGQMKVNMQKGNATSYKESM